MTAISTPPGRRVTTRKVLAIALPIAVANLTIPLLTLADIAAVGQVPDAALIGAVALGGVIFSFVFWGFSFLRMGTTGLTAQAFGADNRDEIRATLGRALLIAGGAGLLIIILQGPIAAIAFGLLHASARVEELARSYFAVRIWIAPLALSNFALTGWFIGRQRARIAVFLQLLLNGLNLTLDLTFVLVFGWGVPGVALGTDIAEGTAALLGLYIAARELKALGGRWRLKRLLDPVRLRRTFTVNRDIMVRSLCLIFVLSFFTAQGAKTGDVTLAANEVLMQFILLAAFLLDAFGTASEALVGESIGAQDRRGLIDAMKLPGLWALGVSLILAAGFLLLGPFVIDILTREEAVRLAARTYLPWCAFAPLVAVWCFQLDSIFIGATLSHALRNAMMASLFVFLLAWWALHGPFGNHGLWAAMMIFYFARAASLAFYLPGLLRRTL
ncbi:MAG: MATE family efflux transporter [Parvibaculaceae bacterium]|nr:MATE family efflux transporter [Parvibaculaceae bacterium]